MAQLASGTAQQTTRRSTRQQSREIESIPPPSPVKGRKQGPATRGASANVHATAANDNFDAQAFDGNNLDTVPEVYQEQDNDGDMIYVNQHGTQSPGGRSNYSGVTAVTSHSATEVELLQADGRAMEFPAATVDLCSRANSIIHVLAPKQATQATLDALTNELQKPGSANSRFLNTREEKLMESFQIFTNEHYIHPRYVIQAAFNTKNLDGIGLGSWRPDAILQKANLARLACQIIPAPDRARVAQMGLNQIDNVFPAPFMTAFCRFNIAVKNIPAGQSKLKDRTFDMALAIRTQLALARLEFGSSQEQNTYDPDETLKQNFLTRNPEDGSFGLPEMWAVSFGEKDQFLTTEMSDAVVDRMSDIRSCFEESSQMPDFDGLEKKFSWSAFKQQLAHWIRSRNEEINTGINNHAGADEIAASWEKQLAQRADEPPEIQFPSGTNKTIRVFSKKTKKPRKSTSNASCAPSAEGAQDGARLPERPRGIVNDAVPIDPQLQATRDIAQLRLSQGQPTRGRSFLDSQPNATRVSFDNSQPSQTPLSTLKRRREADELIDEDASQDAGFQSDERGSAHVEQRRAAVQLANQAQEAQVRRHVEEQQFGQELGQELVEQYPGVVEEEPQPEEEAPPRTQGDIYRTQVQPLAKQMTAVRSSQRTPQLRKNWAIAETDALIDLIEEFGSAYALAKKSDEEGRNRLPDRDAEAMRHKARNMKFDYLKSGVTLPAGFDRVLLDKKFKDRLEALGIPYTQEQARRPRVSKNAAEVAGEEST